MSNGRSQRWSWAALLAAGVVLGALRLHAFGPPLETDECNYAYIGKRLLSGDRLYVDVWDHQPFGAFALFAGLIAAFGDEPHVFRWAATGFSLISLVLVFAILKTAAGQTAAIVGALLFALASSDPGTAGEGCNREIYMNTLILLAWLLALRSDAQPGWGVIGAGAALGAASTLKTLVAVHWFFLGLWLMAARRAESPRPRRTSGMIVNLAMFAAAPALLWSLTFAYFAVTGRGHEFLDAVFLFNLGYAETAEPFASRFIHFFSPPRHPFVFASALPLWIGAAAGSGWLTIKSFTGRDLSAAGLLCLMFAGYVAACLPGRFWPHYYYLLIPPSAMVLSVSVTDLAALVRRRCAQSESVRRAAGGFAALIYAAPVVALAASEYRNYLSQPPFGITITRYNSRDFWGRAQGENVRRVTSADDRIFVFGNDAAIYYYSGRRGASRFTMITGLAGDRPGAQRRRRTLMEELKRHPPRVILVLFAEAPFPQWRAFLQAHYEPAGVDSHDRTGEPIMYVYARQDQPIEPIDWDWDRAEVGGWFLGERR